MKYGDSPAAQTGRAFESHRRDWCVPRVRGVPSIGGAPLPPP